MVRKSKIAMAELFVELFSEEIPSRLQIDAREKIKNIIEEKLKLKKIKFNSSVSFSTPKRLVFFIDGIPSKINQKGKTIKGPKVSSPQIALDGFIKSNNLNKKLVYKKKIEKNYFYFADIKSKDIDLIKELQLIIPDSIKEYSWKKSMKWANYDLNWGRPLRSIATLFNNKVLNFSFYHLKSSNVTFLDEPSGEKVKKIKNFNSYLSILKSQNIILDHKKRKEIILKKFNTICNAKNLKNKFNDKLIEEVVNLVEKPNIITCKFNEKYLKIPKEILIITMQKHQKYFPLFEKDEKLSNLFLLVANLPDQKGNIKVGNQRVIESRLSDANFFWEKNKSQSLVKQVNKLKNLTFFNQLGTFYDKTQRLRKLASLISEQLNINKEKTEIVASICKADLVSDLVGEFPELQGIMGKYFAREQGFEEEVSVAISDHYLPIGVDSSVPKKIIGSAVALVDKIDLLVGFFGIDQKPTSSKDPFALRRSAIGLLRIITENKLPIQIKDLINCSISTYKDQNVTFKNSSIEKDILIFLKERFKNLLRDKKIRNDVINATESLYATSDFLTLYKKSLFINKNISKDIFKKVIEIYKRASNIVAQELKNKKESILGQPETSLFNKEEEKNLFKKITVMRQYFVLNKKRENYEEVLQMLCEAKLETDNFFNNVIVNDKNLNIKKNRLELLQMFCKTYNNFADFSKMEGA